ncbi:MAG: cytoplasmic protein [Clostridiales bacterium]|nr:cytoplasmic protein [Clostridiales bacterium]
MEDRLEYAHQFSKNNKKGLLSDKNCGCFYCLEIFNPIEITEWVPDSEGTALCPYCGVDSIIGEYTGLSITKKFLSEMNEYWFK